MMQMKSKMMDMARPKPKKGDKEMMTAPAMEHEKYPYGLRVTLQKPELDNLGMSIKDFAMGKTCIAECEMEVMSMRESESQGRDPDQSVELQIKRMMIAPSKKSQSEKVEAGMKMVEKMKGSKAY